MEPLKDLVTNPLESKPTPPAQRLEKLTAPKLTTPTPMTPIEKQHALYMSGIAASMIMALVALVVSISANRNRGLDQAALTDAFAGALAKNSVTMAAPAQPNSANNIQNPGTPNSHVLNGSGTNAAETSNPSGNNLGSTTGSGGLNANGNTTNDNATNTSTSSNMNQGNR